MNKVDEQYLELQKRVLEEGTFVGDRTGTGCYSLFGAMMRFNLEEGYSLLTSKKINPANIIGELLWMLGGERCLPSLRHYQNKLIGTNTIWSKDFEKFWEAKVARDPIRYENRPPDEDLGLVYGPQWRDFKTGHYNPSTDECNGHDQVKTLIDNIIAVKNGDMRQARRLIVTAWNPYDHTVGEKETAALSACHDSFQCIVRDGKLSLRFHMRSNDIFLGLPYNIAFYDTLCRVLAKITGLGVGELIYMGTDVHIYSNHIEQVKEQQTREPRLLPKLVLPEFETLEELLELTAKDFKVEGYDPHSFIKAPQAS